MTNFVFKLLELPVNARYEVLRALNHSELFIFSTISTKTKNFVQSLKVPALSLNVGAVGCLEFVVDFGGGTYLVLMFTDPHYKKQSKSSWSLTYKPQNFTIKYITVGQLDEIIRCRNSRYGFRHLTSLLKSIFQFSRLSKLIFYERELITMEDVWETFWDILDQIVVNFRVDDVFAQRILGTFMSKIKRLTLLAETHLNGPISFGHVALQNFDVLAGDQICDLDNLLLCNSLVVRTFPNRFSIKFISRFLHFWIRGSNRRLEYIFFSFPDDVVTEVDTVLKGVAHRDVPEKKVRRIKDNVRENMPMIPDRVVGEVRGGAEIRNKFGIAATVHLVHREGFKAVQIFIFSTISTKTRNLVQSLQVPALFLSVKVSGCLKFEVEFSIRTSLTLVLTDPRQEEQSQSPWSLIHNPQTLTIEYITAGRQHKSIKFPNSKYGFRKLVSHLKSIFEFSRPSMLMFHECELIKVEDVWETFRDILDQVYIEPWFTEELAQRLLRTCHSTAKQLILWRETPLNGAISFGHVALQNLDVLASNQICDLDTLLLCNSLVVRTISNRFSIKFISRFLHSWIRGSNRRLEYIIFPCYDGVATDINTILKEVSYRDVPEGKVRRAKDNVRENMPTILERRLGEVRGGAEIRNKFGIVATVHLVHGETFNAVQMFVWN